MAVTREQWEERAKVETRKRHALQKAREDTEDKAARYDLRDKAGRLQCTVSGCPERKRCLDVDNAARCPLFRMYRRRANGEGIRISGTD